MDHFGREETERLSIAEKMSFWEEVEGMYMKRLVWSWQEASSWLSPPSPSHLSSLWSCPSFSPLPLPGFVGQLPDLYITPAPLPFYGRSCPGFASSSCLWPGVHLLPLFHVPFFASAVSFLMILQVRFCYFLTHCWPSVAEGKEWWPKEPQVRVVVASDLATAGFCLTMYSWYWISHPDKSQSEASSRECHDSYSLVVPSSHHLWKIIGNQGFLSSSLAFVIPFPIVGTIAVLISYYVGYFFL